MTQTTDDVFDAPDPFADNDSGIARPPRTEDKVPRDKNDWPRILPPEEKVLEEKRLRSYARASGYGKILENTWNLERYDERNVAEGFVQDETLRLEWIGTDPEDKDRRNQLVKDAKKVAKADLKSRRGSALHAITERHDGGMSLKGLPNEYKPHLAEWVRLMKDFEILDIETFVVEDTYRIAGTFDRFVYYHVPCPICGKHNRILDLKTTDRIQFGHISMGCQLAAYAHGKRYNPADGSRTDLVDVCLCRGIIVEIPQSTGEGRLHWINIAQGWNTAIRLADEVKSLRNKRNWLADFDTVPDLVPLINEANSREECLVIFNMNQAIWTNELTKAVEARLEAIALQGKAR
jgi:hypothetical protein